MNSDTIIFLAGLMKPKTPWSGQPVFQQICYSSTSWTHTTKCYC